MRLHSLVVTAFGPFAPSGAKASTSTWGNLASSCSIGSRGRTGSVSVTCR